MVKTPNLTLSTEPWPLDETSTRNCRHCLAPKDGGRVLCDKGHLMVGDHDLRGRLTYNRVVTVPWIFKSCKGCADFDNDWGQGSKTENG